MTDSVPSEVSHRPYQQIGCLFVDDDAECMPNHAQLCQTYEQVALRFKVCLLQSDVLQDLDQGSTVKSNVLFLTILVCFVSLSGWRTQSHRRGQVLLH